MTSPDRIIVGISGGVDSAVAALELLDAGHRVEGLFMKNWDDPDDPGHCSIPHDLAAAEAVCGHLGIPLHRVDFSAAYWHRVFEYFLSEHDRGRTPNPDILCNREIKFGLFLDHARELGADRIATGHYARIARGDDGPRLLRGVDPDKDQSYFLHAVHRASLAHATFPLGERRKREVRERARLAGLPNFDRRDSTGICFIGERNFRQFLSAYLPAMPGDIETTEGERIARHHGLMYYTIGQRQGLGIGGGHGDSGEPWYVLAKDLARNVLVIGQGHDHPWLFSEALESETMNWLVDAPVRGFRCSAQVRYRQVPVACAVEPAGEGVRVRFDRPVRAATPGQSLVLYDGDTCLGGGVICRTTRPGDSEPARRTGHRSPRAAAERIS